MVDSGGVDLGPLGQLEGTLPGLNAVSKTLSRTPEWSQLACQHRQYRAAKDFNDQPVGSLAGASSGSAVYGPPQGGPTPGGAGSALPGAAEELGGLA